MTSGGDKTTAVKAGPGHRSLLLLGLIVVVTLSAVFWKPVQERLGAEFMLRSEILDESVFRELVQSSDHPTTLILKAWNTQKVPHRQAVMGFLKDWVQTNALAPAVLTAFTFSTPTTHPPIGPNIDAGSSFAETSINGPTSPFTNASEAANRRFR